MFLVNRLADMAPALMMLRKSPSPPLLQTVSLHYARSGSVHLSYKSLGHDFNIPTLNESLLLTSEVGGEKEKVPLFLTDSITFFQTLI